MWNLQRQKVCELPKARMQNSNEVCGFEIQDVANTLKLSRIDHTIFKYERSSIWSFVNYEIIVGRGPPMYMILRFKVMKLLQLNKSRGK
jgi:ribosomal protein L30/L7E